MLYEVITEVFGNQGAVVTVDFGDDRGAVVVKGFDAGEGARDHQVGGYQADENGQAGAAEKNQRSTAKLLSYNFV